MSILQPFSAAILYDSAVPQSQYIFIFAASLCLAVALNLLKFSIISPFTQKGPTARAADPTRTPPEGGKGLIYPMIHDLLARGIVQIIDASIHFDINSLYIVSKN